MRKVSWCSRYLRRSQVRGTIFRRPWTTALHIWASNDSRPAQLVAPGIRQLSSTTSTYYHATGDSTLSRRNSQLASILQRAPHGIDSLARLAFEADVGHARDIGSKLVDLPVNRQDLDLWLVLLEYRLLKDGSQGLRDILTGMHARGDPVKLLEYDDASEKIWRHSLAAAIDDDRVLQMISHPTMSIGGDKPTLFLDLVKPLLGGKKTQLAKFVAHRLRTSHFRGQSDLHAIFELVLDESSHVTLEDFCAIHHVLPFVSVYTYIMPSLWKSKNSKDALKLHVYLVEHHDFPPTFEHIEPIIRQLALENKPLEPFLAELDKACLSYSAQAKGFYARVKAFQSGVFMEAIDLINIDRPSTRQRTLSDEFVARVLATHALSFEFALKSLKFFGLVEIGPLAIRELGISAKDFNEVKARLRLLDKLQIDTGSSNFAAVVKNLCRGNSPVLLEAVLKCDQHHEVFEDRETQKRLLTEYYYKKDWPQINRTLAILNRGNTGPSAQSVAQHMLLKSAIIARDWRSALLQLTSILGKGQEKDPKLHQDLASNTLDLIFGIIFAKGNKSRLSDKLYINRIRYLIGVLQDMEFSGISVDFKYWKGILFQLAFLAKFSDLKRLSLWLAAFYHKKHQILSTTSNPSKYPAETQALGNLFDPRLQAALLQWGLLDIVGRSIRPNQGLKHRNRGFDVLQVLERSYGIDVDRREVKKLYQDRLESLEIPCDMVERLMKEFDEVMLPSHHQNMLQTENPDLGFVNPFFQVATSGA